MIKFKTSYTPVVDKPYIKGEPSKTQQHFRNQNNPHAVVQRHTITSNIPTYINTYDLDPLTHKDKIENLKKQLDSETLEMKKLEDEKKQKEENEQYEKFKERFKTENPEYQNGYNKTKNVVS